MRSLRLLLLASLVLSPVALSLLGREAPPPDAIEDALEGLADEIQVTELRGELAFRSLGVSGEEAADLRIFAGPERVVFDESPWFRRAAAQNEIEEANPLAEWRTRPATKELVDPLAERHKIPELGQALSEAQRAASFAGLDPLQKIDFVPSEDLPYGRFSDLVLNADFEGELKRAVVLRHRDRLRRILFVLPPELPTARHAGCLKARVYLGDEAVVTRRDYIPAGSTTPLHDHPESRLATRHYELDEALLRLGADALSRFCPEVEISAEHDIPMSWVLRTMAGIHRFAPYVVPELSTGETVSARKDRDWIRVELSPAGLRAALKVSPGRPEGPADQSFTRAPWSGPQVASASVDLMLGGSEFDIPLGVGWSLWLDPALSWADAIALHRDLRRRGYAPQHWRLRASAGDLPLHLSLLRHSASYRSPLADASEPGSPFGGLHRLRRSAADTCELPVLLVDSAGLALESYAIEAIPGEAKPNIPFTRFKNVEAALNSFAARRSAPSCPQLELKVDPSLELGALRPALDQLHALRPGLPVYPSDL